jgi:hypothetical protein
MPAAKYKFSGQESYDHNISKETGGFVGTLRVKSSTILWKPSGARSDTPWYSVNLDEFIHFATEKNHKVSK